MDFLLFLPSAEVSILPKMDLLGPADDGASDCSAELAGWKAGTAGLNAGPDDSKLKSDLLGVNGFEFVLLPKPPNPPGVKDEAVGLNAAACGLNAGAAALKLVKDLLKVCGDGEIDFLPLEPGPFFSLLAGVNENADGEKMPGLNEALGLPFGGANEDGLNSLAATLRPEIDDFDEWCDKCAGLEKEVEFETGLAGLLKKVGSFAHGLAVSAPVALPKDGATFSTFSASSLTSAVDGRLCFAVDDGVSDGH